MKFKKSAKIETSDFYYDLFDGGYIRPDELLEDKTKAKNIIEAIKLIREFKDQCEKHGILEEL